MVTARAAGSVGKDAFNSPKGPGPLLASAGAGTPRALSSLPGTQQSWASPFKTPRPVTIPQGRALSFRRWKQALTMNTSFHSKSQCVGKTGPSPGTPSHSRGNAPSSNAPHSSISVQTPLSPTVFSKGYWTSAVSCTPALILLCLQEAAKGRQPSVWILLLQHRPKFKKGGRKEERLTERE